MKNVWKRVFLILNIKKKVFANVYMYCNYGAQQICGIWATSEAFIFTCITRVQKGSPLSAIGSISHRLYAGDHVTTWRHGGHWLMTS